MTWKKIGESEVLKHPRMHLVEDDVILPDGSKTKYLREINRKDYVTVIARHEGKVVMVRDYSYPNDQMLLQFSEGWIEDGESLEQAAARELLEETGLHANKVTQLGKNLHNHRRNTTFSCVMLAEDTKDTGETNLESTEHGLEVVLLAEDEIWDKIASGEIIQKNALAAWALYAAISRNEAPVSQRV